MSAADDATRIQITRLGNETVRLKNLVNAIIQTAIETIASLHVRPEKCTTDDEEKIMAESAQLFVMNLKRKGLYPEKKSPTDIIRPN